MCGVCFFEFGIVSLGEAQKPFGTSPVAKIDGRRGGELQIMDVGIGECAINATTA
jgi:hypothetical protein